jgi:hypothetical protein
VPKILDAAVKQIKKNSPGVNPFAAATATLHKSGELKPGTNQPTAKGVARGQMSQAQRQKTKP